MTIGIQGKPIDQPNRQLVHVWLDSIGTNSDAVYTPHSTEGINTNTRKHERLQLNLQVMMEKFYQISGDFATFPEGGQTLDLPNVFFNFDLLPDLSIKNVLLPAVISNPPLPVSWSLLWEGFEGLQSHCM